MLESLNFNQFDLASVVLVDIFLVKKW
jgi:hypothetical protein